MTPQPSAESSAPVFEIRDVTFSYADVAALNGLSLAVHRGERCALLGANGSGKSTLLRLLDGLDDPQSGDILFCGAPLTQQRLQDDAFAFDFRRRVGLVFQNPDVQLFSPTVFDELAFGPLQLRWPSEEIRLRVTETLESMEIAHLKDRSPHQLSIGEKKSVALASVLILDPEILLLDEPTASLDPKNESRMIDFLAKCKGGARTVVVATHDLGIARDTADRCFIFQNGRIAAGGTPEEVLSDASLLERTNLVRARRSAV